MQVCLLAQIQGHRLGAAIKDFAFVCSFVTQSGVTMVSVNFVAALVE